MLIVGLTGSIGMGKSAVAARFREHGIAVFDADAEVHRLYRGPAAHLIEAAFPGTTNASGVDRVKLAQSLNLDATSFKRLEAIVHPLVWQAERDFLQAALASGARLAILEIPLLFEGGNDTKLDAVVVASARAEVQRKRVLERAGMTDKKLDSLLARQLPDAEKRRRADFVVDTNGSMAETHAQTDVIIGKLRDRPAQAYAQYWI